MSIITILASAATKLPKVVLASIGIGIISFGSVLTAFNLLLSEIQTTFNGLPADALSIMDLGGVTTGLGIVLGALTARLTIQSISKLGLLNGLT